MRLIYIGILIPITLLAAAAFDISLLTKAEFWVPAVFGGLFANICYFAGPIVDTYTTWIGFRGNALRYTMFIIGTAGCAMLALIFVFSISGQELIPSQD